MTPPRLPLALLSLALSLALPSSSPAAFLRFDQSNFASANPIAVGGIPNERVLVTQGPAGSTLRTQAGAGLGIDGGPTLNGFQAITAGESLTFSFFGELAADITITLTNYAPDVTSAGTLQGFAANGSLLASTTFGSTSSGTITLPVSAALGNIAVASFRVGVPAGSGIGFAVSNITFTIPATAPEPASIAMMGVGLGLAGAGVAARRRRA